MNKLDVGKKPNSYKYEDPEIPGAVFEVWESQPGVVTLTIGDLVELYESRTDTPDAPDEFTLPAAGVLKILEGWGYDRAVD